MSYLPIVIAASIAASFMDGRDDGFPTEAIVRSHMNAAQKDFRSADSNYDCWIGFLPLLNATVQYQDGESLERVSAVERAIIDNFLVFIILVSVLFTIKHKWITGPTFRSGPSE